MTGSAHYAALPRRGFSVDENAMKLNELAFVLAQCTRLLASWAPTIPELEVKMMLGNHVHRDATATQALHTRIRGLCRDPSDSSPVADDWLRTLSALAATSETLPRLYGMYQVAKRRLLQELATHVDSTHGIWDEPTAILLDDIARGIAGQIAWATSIQDQMRAAFHPEVGEHEAEAKWKEALAAARPSRELQFPTGPELATDPRMSYAEEVSSLAIATSEETAMFLHFLLVVVEVGTIEVCGRMITDFPEMPWDFVADMGRQCWDESRHAYLAYQRVRELGHRIGEFPVTSDAWQLSYGLPLERRLAVHQMTGEWLGVDMALAATEKLAERGDEITARIFEYVTVDEIAHAAFGKKWIHFLLADSAKESELHEWAIAYRDAARKRSGPVNLPVNRWACERAGFTPEEIDRLEQTRAARPPAVTMPPNG